jgi:hypothetical protein
MPSVVPLVVHFRFRTADPSAWGMSPNQEDRTCQHTFHGDFVA